MALPLSGLLVVSVEQAVAAPQCTCRLADAGARVIKVERPEGDFAREYDHLVSGQCSYFVWLNRGKQSLVLDLTGPDDKALLERFGIFGPPTIAFFGADGIERRNFRVVGYSPAEKFREHVAAAVAPT